MAKTKDSPLVQHVYNNIYSIDWENIKIVSKENHWLKRKLKEAWIIFKKNSIDYRKQR